MNYALDRSVTISYQSPSLNNETRFRLGPSQVGTHIRLYVQSTCWGLQLCSGKLQCVACCCVCRMWIVRWLYIAISWAYTSQTR